MLIRELGDYLGDYLGASRKGVSSECTIGATASLYLQN